jgi:hypothetical protein
VVGDLCGLCRLCGMLRWYFHHWAATVCCRD